MSNLKFSKHQSHKCARCGSDDIEVKHEGDTVEFKGLTVEAHGLAYTQCKNCQLRWCTAGQELDNMQILKSAFITRRDEIRIKEGLLTGEQIASILEQLDLNKSAAATVFGGGPNAFSKYINGDVLQSFAMDRLLRLTLAFGAPALGFLRLGADAPLKKYAGGVFISASTNVMVQVPGAASETVNASRLMFTSSANSAHKNEILVPA